MFAERVMDIDYQQNMIPDETGIIYETAFGDRHFIKGVEIISFISPYIECITISLPMNNNMVLWRIYTDKIVNYDIEIAKWYLGDSPYLKRFLNIIYPFMNFNDFVSINVAKKQNSANKGNGTLYKSIIDVLSLSEYVNDDKYACFTIVDSGYIFNQKIKHYIASIPKEKADKLLEENGHGRYDDFIDKSFKIDYTISKSSGILLVRDITIVGSSTYKRIIYKWMNYLNKLKTAYHSLPIKINKIALITNTETHAYYDFIDFFNYLQFVKVENIILNYKEIAKKILELEQSDCQVICIVRGGGSQESLLQFSHPLLIRAMDYSSKYIVTGIGHANDKPLCEYVAEYAASTPTDAAYHLAYLIAKQNDKQDAKVMDIRKPRCLLKRRNKYGMV